MDAEQTLRSVVQGTAAVTGSDFLSLLEIFAARASAELERQRAEDELRGAPEEVERLRNRLLAENVYLQEEIRDEHNFESWRLAVNRAFDLAGRLKMKAAAWTGVSVVLGAITTVLGALPV